MLKVLLNSLLVSPAVLGAALAVSSAAIAAEKQAEISASPLATIAATTQALESIAPSKVSQPEVKQIASATVPADVKVAGGATVEATQPLQVADFKNLTLLAPAPVQIAQVPAALADVSIDQINRYSREGRTGSTTAVGQVTSVSQLSDVRPTDWAFQALQSLVERYGCIAGYPDKTYRGNRALTRYEFAAGLNACLDRVNELIAAATADLVKKEDLATLQKLQEEFAAELATLRGRVDALEARTTTLEKQQFSTTTKLAGEAIFAITDEFGVKGTGGNNTVFQDRVRLAFNTSFTGKDLLITRIAAGNANTFALNNPNRAGGANAEGIQTFNFGNTGGNQAFIDWVAYYFNLNDKVRFYVPAVAGLHYDYAPTASPALDAADGGTGPLSIFAQRNPIYQIGGGAGVGVNVELTPAFTISGGYLADNSGIGGAVVAGANNPGDKGGLFNGSYSALGQVTFKASEALTLALTYVNAYRRSAIFDTGNGGSGASGTLLANQGTTAGGVITPAKVNAYGASVAFRLSPQLVLNAFGSYINADFIDDGAASQDIWTYGAGLALPDFGKKGNLLGFTAGVEPYRGDVRPNSLPLHFEGFYKYQLNDNISVTPGLIWIVNPGQNDNNDNIVIGTVRTTFTF
jgi:Carbohydrate-selective porin, OprB family/S-layer homology domain